MFSAANALHSIILALTCGKGNILQRSGCMYGESSEAQRWRQQRIWSQGYNKGGSNEVARVIRGTAANHAGQILVECMCQTEHLNHEGRV